MAIDECMHGNTNHIYIYVQYLDLGNREKNKLMTKVLIDLIELKFEMFITANITSHRAPIKSAPHDVCAVWHQL